MGLGIQTVNAQLPSPKEGVPGGDLGVPGWDLGDLTSLSETCGVSGGVRSISDWEMVVLMTNTQKC